MATTMKVILSCFAMAAARSISSAWSDARLDKHVGPVHTALLAGKEVVVATDASVLASLAIRSGAVTWRWVAGEDEQLLDVAVQRVPFESTLSLSVVGEETLVRRREHGALSWTAAIAGVGPAGAAGPLLAVQGDRVAAAAGDAASVLQDAVTSSRSLKQLKAKGGEHFVSLGWTTGGRPELFAVAMATGAAQPTAVTLYIVGENGEASSTKLSFGAAVAWQSVSAVPATAGAVVVAAAADGEALLLVCPGSKTASRVELVSLLEQAGADSAAPRGKVSALAVLRSTTGGAAAAIAQLSLSLGATLFVTLAPSASTCTATGLVYSAAGAVGSAASLGTRTWAAIVEAGAPPTARVVDVESKAAEAVQLSTTAADVATHGPVMRVFAFPFTKAGSEGEGWRLTVLHADGTLVTSQNGATLWSGDEGSACAVQALIMDVPERKRRAGGKEEAEEAGSDPALTLPARLAAQGQAVVSMLLAVGEAARALQASFQVDPSSALLSLVGLGLKGGRHVGAMAPFVRTGVEHVVVARTRVDGGAPGVCEGRGGAHSGRAVHGALTAKTVDSGDALWTLALPLGAGAGAAAAAAPAGEWLSAVVPTRHRPIRGHGAEVLVVESGPVGKGLFGVWVTSVDVASGRSTGTAYYTTASALDRVARTPVVHTASQRGVHLLMHAGGEAVAVPGPADVQAALAGLGPDFVVAAPTYDARADVEGVAGLVLAGGAKAFVGGAAGVGAVVGPTPAGSAPLPLAFGRMGAAWSQVLARGAAGDRLLALHVGRGATAIRPVLSAHVGEGGEEALLQRAVAGSGEATDGLSDGGSLPHGAGPHAPVSHVTVLGDDSLLLKYSLGHTLVAVVGSPARARALASPFDLARAAARERTRAAAAAGLPQLAPPKGSSGNLTLHLINAVSGASLHARRVPGCRGPVGLAVTDNWAAMSYWNEERARPEISVVEAFEGAIDRTALTPWSKSTAAAAARAAAPTLSAHTQPPPVLVAAAFILPASLKPGALELTRSGEGISSPFLLLGLSSGGVMTLDKRLVEARRPMPNAVREADKAEGLIPYATTLPFAHANLVTHGDAVGRLRSLSSCPSGLESTSLLLALGVDSLLARVAPARAWDTLDREFNAAGLLALLAALGVVTVLLGRLVKTKALAEQWKP